MGIIVFKFFTLLFLLSSIFIKFSLPIANFCNISLSRKFFEVKPALQTYSMVLCLLFATGLFILII